MNGKAASEEGEAADRSAATAGDDTVQPFHLESSGIRGRLLRLGPLADTILGRHAYPEPVALLLAELLALTGALASLMQYEGVFTVQTKGDGPVRMMVTDVTAEGDLRGYAAFDQERLDQLLVADPSPSFQDLCGKGYFAYTVDRGPDKERYQGIVALQGESLAACLQHYFLQSDQVQSGIVLAADRQAGHTRAGALILQRVPEEGGAAIPGGPAPDDEEAWRRAMVLQVTCTPQELLDPGLSVDRLLYRLFHEEGVRVFEPRRLAGGCRCSQQKIERVLASLQGEEVMGLMENGAVEVNCEFCNRTYRFDEAALAQLYGAVDAPSGEP